MRSRAVRLTLTVLAVAAIGAAAYFSWILQHKIGDVATAAAAFDQRRTAAERYTFELRSAQQAYVAAGQSEAFWFDRATTLADALRAALAELKTATTAPAAHTAIDEAIQVLDEFRQRDRRVRSYASSGQKLLASDVIFSDGLESASRILSALDQAAVATAQTHGLETATHARQRLMAVAGAGGVVILALLLLTPVRSRPADASETVAAVPVRAPEATGGLDLRSTPRAPEKRPAAQVPTPAAAPPPAIEIHRLATVCTDLARLTDTSAMPAILERTAAALDAAGLVVWVVNAEGRELLPLAAHGYPASVLSRMGSLPVDAANATASAFRTGLVQTVKGDGKSNGAIAAPLVSPSGCLGVMSVEIRNSGERLPARQAAAAIVAAQLATLVGPPAARAEDRTTAAL